MSRFRAARYVILFVGEYISEWMFSIMGVFRLVTYRGDVEQARTYRSRVVWQEALRRGIAVEQAYIFGTSTEIFRVRHMGYVEHYVSIPIPLTRDQLSYTWIDDKYILKQELRAAKVPVPLSESVTNVHEAHAAFQKIGGTVIVKPQVGTRGRHTTTNVTTFAELDTAFKSAQRLCKYVSIEEHLVGSVCRATVVDTELVGFFQADPPVMVGDDHSSIRALINEANRTHDERVAIIEVTAEMETFLSRQKYTLDSIPDVGVKVSLTHRTGRLFGGKTRELLDTVHPKLRAYVEKAARTLDVAIVGFDLIIADPEKDPDGQKWGIIEANTLPFIDLHYLPLYGTASNPAKAVWDLWEKHHTRTP